MADRTQRAVGIARRSAHQHAFDRAFQEGGVALPQITVRPDDDQQPVEPYTMAQPDYMRPQPPLSEQIWHAVPEPLQEAGLRAGEALRTQRWPEAADWPQIAAGAVLGVAGPKGGSVAERAAAKAAEEAGSALTTVGARAAPYAKYAEEYPPVGPPQLMSKATLQPYKLPRGQETWDVSDPEAQRLVASHKAYWSKQLTPETEEFAKTRTAIQRAMAEQGYKPYFDPAQRAPIDPAVYPSPQDMATQALPAQAATIAKYRAMYDTPEARERLQRAYDIGKTVPGAENWYHMRQLYDAYVKELGAGEGGARFKRDFAEAMAGTTGGAAPTPNLLMAHLANYMRNKGIDPFPPSHQLPYPVGGRYAGSNLSMYQKTVGSPGFAGFDVKNPKRYDFSYSFLGNPAAATIDEQMSDIIKPGMQKPEGSSYGVASQLVREMAARNGVHPQNFQDVAWAGHKKMTTEAAGKPFAYEGPMISHVNAAIERTHRLTGMPREEVVRRGLIRGEIPLYGAAAGASAAANQDEGVIRKRAKGGKVTASQMARRHAHQQAFDQVFPRR